MKCAFKPERQVQTELSGERTVTVQTDGEKFGVIFFNGEEETRCLLSSEAMAALCSSYAPLVAGRGELVAYEWRLMPDERLVAGGLQ